MFKKIQFLNRTEKLFYLIFGVINLISLIILIILVGVKIIEWNWITGYFLGLCSSIVALIIIKLAIKDLVKNENHYFYYFMFLIRVGIYFVSLLLAFLIPGEPFYFIGVIIGLAPIVMFPYVNVFLLRNKIKNSYQFERKEIN